jgi:hypothetical protein
MCAVLPIFGLSVIVVSVLDRLMRMMVPHGAT